MIKNQTIDRSDRDAFNKMLRNLSNESVSNSETYNSSNLKSNTSSNISSQKTATSKYLTDSQKQRINNILIVESGASFVGAIAGVIYSKRTGGGFWRGVGYFILGSAIFGLGTRIVTTPFKNKILKEK